MYKIGICFINRDFEHDIFELIRAFYPEAEFSITYNETSWQGDLFAGAEQDDSCGEQEDSRLGFTIWKENDMYVITYHSQDKTGRICAGAEEGQPGKKGEDALLLRDETSAEGSRKRIKDRIKYGLYNVLVSLSGRTLPWGNLTGIRPAKLAMAMLEEGRTNPEIAQELRSRYLVSAPKAALAVTIANRERDILKEMDCEHGYSLYVGIPFCPSICLYCSFSSYPLSVWKKRVHEYLEALIREIDAVSLMMGKTGRHLDTVYIGGGTPTTLEPDELRLLLHEISDKFPVSGAREFTVEAGRPDSIEAEKLKALKEFPVSRISVNPQTMNQQTLDLIGRKHTVEDTVKAFYLAREAGFDDINMDLIIGLPGENETMVRHTLDSITGLSPDSMTVHSLAVKRAARLNIFKDQYKEMTFENNQHILDLTMKAAYGMGMGPYYLYRQKNMKGNFENVGYSKVDKAGIYNILIMEEKEPVIALGAGGASKLVIPESQRIERVENVKDVANYIERIDEMIERKRVGISSCL